MLFRSYKEYQLIARYTATADVLPNVQYVLQVKYYDYWEDTHYKFVHLEDAKQFVKRFIEYNGMIKEEVIDL